MGGLFLWFSEAILLDLPGSMKEAFCPSQERNGCNEMTALSGLGSGGTMNGHHGRCSSGQGWKSWGKESNSQAAHAGPLYGATLG